MSGLLERCEGLDPTCREIVLSQYRYALELGAAHEDARASAERLAAAFRESPTNKRRGPADHCPHCGGSGFDPWSRDPDPETGKIHMDRCHVCCGAA